MLVLEHLWIIPLLPLLGAAVKRLFRPRLAARRDQRRRARARPGFRSWRQPSWFASSPASTPSQIPWTHSYFTWIAAGTFRADYALQVDQLTIVMLLVVTGVGWLIHLYSTGYMADDAGYRRFFSYLNLFMFFMLTLVLAANYTAAVCRLGGRRAVQLPADRLLVPEERPPPMPATKRSG